MKTDPFVPRVLLACIPLVFGCTWLQQQTEGPCPPTDLAAIEARFVVEATRACRAEGAETLAECKAYPAIRDKYRAERDAYVECK